MQIRIPNTGLKIDGLLFWYPYCVGRGPDLRAGGDVPRDGAAVSGEGLRIRIHFIRIRIQHFRLNTDPDPDPIRIQSFNDQKLKKITDVKNKFFFDQKLQFTYP